MKCLGNTCSFDPAGGLSALSSEGNGESGRGERRAHGSTGVSESVSWTGAAAEAYIWDIFNHTPLAYYGVSSEDRAGSKFGSISSLLCTRG